MVMLMDFERRGQFRLFLADFADFADFADYEESFQRNPRNQREIKIPEIS